MRKAKRLAMEILTDADCGFEFGHNFIFRLFLASSRSFKYHVCCLEGLSDSLKDRIVACKMPKFIWCAEIYTRQGFSKKIAKGLIIMDATEANDAWVDSLIFAGYPDRCLAKFNKSFVDLPYKFVRYSKFNNNLR